MVTNMRDVTPSGFRQTESWHRRGHAVTCWQDHERCALISARDLMENRAAQARARAGAFRTAVDRIDRLEPLPVDPALVETARRMLREYHAALRAGREK